MLLKQSALLLHMCFPKVINKIASTHGFSVNDFKTLLSLINLKMHFNLFAHLNDLLVNPI